MKLENEFTVSAPIEQTWTTLLDIERVATCLPGASVEPGEGDGVYRGAMKMKLGPVTVDYKGTAKMLEVDEDAHVATMEAKAREAKGQGTAAATITNRLTPEGGATRVTVTTDLNITGRQAQFGRGIMQDVAEKMLGEFATRLEQEILAGPSVVADANGRAATVSSTPARASAGATAPAAGPSEPLDLGNVVTGPLLKRAAPVVGGGLLLAVLALVLRRRPGRGFSLTLNYR
jgi:carbon monoxide dehydrogenase subunit G